MAKDSVTFQVLEGIDKGRIFRELPTPITIGREEGNVLRLNDERISRFHAKLQIDDDDYILTDLESTNGTRVNGSVVQIRRLRPGDRVAVGRSILLFGSNEEIAARMSRLEGMNPGMPRAAAAGDRGGRDQDGVDDASGPGRTPTSIFEGVRPRRPDSADDRTLSSSAIRCCRRFRKS